MAPAPGRSALDSYLMERSDFRSDLKTTMNNQPGGAMKGFVILLTIVSALPSGLGAQISNYDPAHLTANPYVGTPLSTYDPRVSRYSADGALNPYTTGGGEIYAHDGAYLGKLNSNRY